MTTHDSDNASGGFVSFERVLRDDSEVPSYWPFSARWFRDNAAARIRELERENGALKAALSIARPHVLSAKDAEHMLDGFKPRSRPIDDQLRVVDAALAAQPSTPAEDEKG